ncbi:MAG: cupin domain-containing protein [Phycisphaerales bacterium]
MTPQSHSPRPPDLINPVTGDRLWFVQLPAGADQSLVFECQLPARSKGTPVHVHTRITERFECVEGELSMILGDVANPIRLARGQAADVPIGTPHRFWNAADLPVRFRGTVTPGVDFEAFLRMVYALGIAGRVGPSGMPRSPVQLAVLRELSDLYFAGVPMFIQRPLFAALSLLATVGGARSRLHLLASNSHPHTPRSA